MVPKVTQIRDELADREAIRDCLFRYCRGLDRMDPESLASAFWPGGMHNGTGYSDTIEQFVEWSLPRLAEMGQRVHMIGNIQIRIEGDRAKVESYLWSVIVMPGDNPEKLQFCGRYNDRFEKRDDEWRIAEHWVVHDWFEQSPDIGDWSVGPFGMTGLMLGAMKPDDQSYAWLGME